ncbi:hypothetical protein CLAFUW4_06106 [Fulvia fulva]|uniref:Uncharacterized protein n=1 Tax=Passalora fulva TaxID=5499 RepID=A0A9Q8P903_PASFU|nr:uncharacterized protein CLAFUR5_06250 [Fulvia fulva]KAK4624038.1 hypothetical protein CLAFUR4_06110 [Fulvia fulva]KAK4625707.1 hypothetical protein CLAFUR0_06114 [Fulvia fulva]UJO17446.1 hypothetical protein CLAFUR5_06250 [Fulvia fulva]WPV15410.1 hypothetical protein CLAFUW4_06106 [Fulvia fulva]WPV30236.1 hypothetical protein CLAFUW7_06103 [Fulvia fulva]
MLPHRCSRNILPTTFPQMSASNLQSFLSTLHVEGDDCGEKNNLQRRDVETKDQTDSTCKIPPRPSTPIDQIDCDDSEREGHDYGLQQSHMSLPRKLTLDDDFWSQASSAQTRRAEMAMQNGAYHPPPQMRNNIEDERAEEAEAYVLRRMIINASAINQPPPADRDTAWTTLPEGKPAGRAVPALGKSGKHEPERRKRERSLSPICCRKRRPIPANQSRAAPELAESGQHDPKPYDSILSRSSVYRP